MTGEEKTDLKIKVLSSEKEAIRAASTNLGYNSMSKYILDCVRARPLERHLETSRRIMHSLDRLHELETSDRYSSYSRKDRRAIAEEARTTLMYLCRDARKL